MQGEELLLNSILLSKAKCIHLVPAWFSSAHLRNFDLFPSSLCTYRISIDSLRQKVDFFLFHAPNRGVNNLKRSAVKLLIENLQNRSGGCSNIYIAVVP